MTQESSLVPTMIALALPAAASVALSVARPELRSGAIHDRRLFIVVGLTILGQVAHFAEELATELYEVFPPTFGYPAADRRTFVTANVTALVVWALSLLALRLGVIVALLPLWFLGFCEVLNLFLHPALALATGGYYPGVATAPIVGILGVLTLRELFRVTGRAD